MVAPKQQHYGKIDIATLLEVLTANGRVVDTKPVYAETYEYPRTSLRNHVRILSKIRPEEATKYSKMYAQEHPTAPLPKTLPTHRLMAILWYDDAYSQGFALEVFTTNHKQFGNNLARTLQERFDGTGLPPFVPRYMKEMKYAHFSH